MAGPHAEVREETAKAILRMLSLKWKDLRDNEVCDTREFTWLVDRGLIEIGTDVCVEAESTGEFKQILCQFTGCNARAEIDKVVTKAARLSATDRARVELATAYFYCRLTDDGIIARRTGNMPADTVAFVLRPVNQFDQRETADELLRYEVDNGLRILVRSSMKVPFQSAPPGRALGEITEFVRQRMTAQELQESNPNLSRYVETEAYEVFRRSLVADLWPDLGKAIARDGSLAAFVTAARLMNEWTGFRFGIPCCHADWRTLCEWAGLELDEITEAGLRERLLPRLRVLWQRHSQGQLNDPDGAEDDWPGTPPTTNSRYQHGPVSSNLKTLEKCSGMDRRTLKANNGESYFYIRKVNRTKYEAWLDSKTKYAEWNAEVLGTK